MTAMAASSATSAQTSALGLPLPKPIGPRKRTTAAKLRIPASWAGTPTVSLSPVSPQQAEKLKVKLPDGSELELDSGATGAEAAAAIGSGLAKAALAVKVDGELRDLSAALSDGASIEIVTDKSPEALELIRHDAAHVLAESVLDLWPNAKISIGPPIADGFYYDIEFPDGSPGEDDLPRIEERMAEHIKADEPFERRDVSTDEAIEQFRDQGQDYKVELIEDLVRDQGEKTVSLYRNGPFEDL